MSASEGRDTIVVGVDGSPEGRRALEWALDEAGRRDVDCLVVHAVDFGLIASSPYAARAIEEVREAGSQVLADELAFAKPSGVRVRGLLELRSAAETLIEASRDALMLVVGSRGHGGFTGLLLGSVSSACVHHAHCPVVVVHPLDRVQAGDAQSPAA